MAYILWQNDDGQAAIWTVNGVTVVSQVLVGENPGPAWHVIGSGDFNGDGQMDILWQNDDGRAAIWFLNDMMVVSAPVIGSNPGPSWHVIASGDFNGDGKSDILWQNDSGAGAIWLMDGASVTSSPVLASNPGASWHAVASGDFNGDGKADILWQNDKGQVAIWLMDGTTVTDSPVLADNPGPSWHPIASGDFDGDGKSDIVWQNDDGLAAIWFMNGPTVLSAPVVGNNPGPAWHLKGAGDFDGDGKSDILWQNDDGQAAIWFMNGSAVRSDPAVGDNPGSAWKIVGPAVPLESKTLEFDSFSPQAEASLLAMLAAAGLEGDYSWSDVPGVGLVGQVAYPAVYDSGPDEGLANMIAAAHAEGMEMVYEMAGGWSPAGLEIFSWDSDEPYDDFYQDVMGDISDCQDMTTLQAYSEKGLTKEFSAPNDDKVYLGIPDYKQTEHDNIEDRAEFKLSITGDWGAMQSLGLDSLVGNATPTIPGLVETVVVDGYRESSPAQGTLTIVPTLVKIADASGQRYGTYDIQPFSSNLGADSQLPFFIANPNVAPVTVATGHHITIIDHLDGANGAGHLEIQVDDFERVGKAPIDSQVLSETIGSVPAKIYTDNASDTPISFTFNVTEQQAVAVEGAILSQELSNPQYNSLFDNCVTFVEDVLAAGGVQTPIGDTFPGTSYNALMALQSTAIVAGGP